MQSTSHLKITVVSNSPSEQALRSFQRKLYQLHRSSDLKKKNYLPRNGGTAKK